MRGRPKIQDYKHGKRSAGSQCQLGIGLHRDVKETRNYCGYAGNCESQNDTQYFGLFRTEVSLAKRQLQHDA